jgi:hypothetical protein
MKSAQFQFALTELKLDILQIKKVLGGLEDGSQEIISCLVGEVLKEIKGISSIKGEYIIYPNAKFNNDDKSLEIADVKFNLNRLIYRQVIKSESIGVFLCTAGKEIGDISRKMMNEGDILKGYIYDIVGTAIVDAAGDLLHEKLGAVMKQEDQKLTNRYSPGHCKWNVVEQHKLFSLIPDNFCGIRLTDSALMDPIKSISGIIGIGKNVEFNPYTCNMCDLLTCNYRNLKVKMETVKEDTF